MVEHVRILNEEDVESLPVAACVDDWCAYLNLGNCAQWDWCSIDIGSSCETADSCGLDWS